MCVNFVRFRVSGFGFRVQSLGSKFGIWVWGLGLGFGVWGLGFGVWGLGFGVWGLGFGVWGLGFGVLGLKREGASRQLIISNRGLDANVCRAISADALKTRSSHTEALALSRQRHTFNAKKCRPTAPLHKR